MVRRGSRQARRQCRRGQGSTLLLASKQPRLARRGMVRECCRTLSASIQPQLHMSNRGLARWEPQNFEGSAKVDRLAQGWRAEVSNILVRIYRDHCIEATDEVTKKGQMEMRSKESIWGLIEFASLYVGCSKKASSEMVHSPTTNFHDAFLPSLHHAIALNQP